MVSFVCEGVVALYAIERMSVVSMEEGERIPSCSGEGDGGEERYALPPRTKDEEEGE